jgi:hypothetical protein
MDFPLAPTRSRKPQNDSRSQVRWTPEEDDLLRSLVSVTHPNSWSAIAKFFPSKTPSQLCGRWEKVLNPQLVKGSWTREEDEAIRAFVDQNGTKDWAKLASSLPGRTGKQCRERFKNHLDPSLHRNPWSESDDQKLIDLHHQFGNQWTRIASFFDGRTDNCIKNRWNSTLKKRLHRIQSGEPLVQKRGRKPRSYSIPSPEIAETEDRDGTPWSSPLLGQAKLVPLTFDPSSLMMMARRPHGSSGSSTLAENRLDFQRLLKEST